MKRFLLTILTGALCLSVNGELTKDQKKRLKDVEIAGVREKTEKEEETKNKYELMEINTFQNSDDQGEGFRIRIVVELTDKLKTRYRVDFTGNHAEVPDTGYTGEDYWRVYIPYGELQNLKISSYVIQYGFMDGEEFVVFAEKFDHAKSMEELLARTSTPFPETIRVKNYYMYSDSQGSDLESIMRDVRQVKEQSL